jgi:Glycosyl hydrolase family 36 C-terminal domain
MNSSVYVGEHDGDACGPLELISRMGGSLTLCGHIAGWSAGHASRVRRLLDGFRAVRHVLMGDFYRLTAYPRGPDDWDVVQFLETERGEAVVLAARVRGERGQLTVFPQRLDPDTTYRVRDPFSDGDQEPATGRELSTTGLRLSLDPESALIRHLAPVR